MIFEDSDSRNGRCTHLQRDPQFDTGALSPFVLNLPVNYSPSIALSKEQLDSPDGLRGNELCISPMRRNQPIRTMKPHNKVAAAFPKSRSGTPYPSFPPVISKRIASACITSLNSKETKLGKETLAAIVEASERYFLQISEDLGAFAHHAGRKQIGERDAIAVMERYKCSMNL